MSTHANATAPAVLRGVAVTPALRDEIRTISTDKSLTDAQKSERRQAAFARARAAHGGHQA